MYYAVAHKASKAAVAFVRALPREWRRQHTYNLALQACAAAADLDSANTLMDHARKIKLKPDVILLTTYMSGGYPT
jgi:hypothetical protein